MRIQKYLSQQGILSRREAESFIRAGQIRLNGKIVTAMGVQIDPAKDKIEVLNSNNPPSHLRIALRSSYELRKGSPDLQPRLSAQENKITVAVYKPRGIVCSRNNAEGKTIFEEFPKFTNLNAVGRLDKESEGLILLSNDGVVTAVVTGADHKVEKEYMVTTREAVTERQIRRLEKGIMIDGQKTLPARGKILGDYTFALIISEGRNHQIRRMADAVHLTIESLKRVRVGNIKLNNLKSGQSRILTVGEVAGLKRLKATSH